MIRDALKRAGALLADFVASDRLDLLARQLTDALDEVARLRRDRDCLRAAEVQVRAELAGLREEHERQLGALLSARKALSEAERSASERDRDWAWAQLQLREGKVVTHPMLDPRSHAQAWPNLLTLPRLWRVGTDRDHCFKLETEYVRSTVSHPCYPGTVGWRVIDPAPSYEVSDAPSDG